MANNADNYYPSDEIDLRDLIQTLWFSKILILAITLVITCFAAIYAFSSTPIYQTSVHTLPPTPSGLANYNMASQLTGEAIRGTVPDTTSGIASLSPQEVYKTFLRHLNSSTIRQSFFDKYYLPAQEKNESESDKQHAWQRLDKELTINLPKKTDEFEASIELEGKNPQIIATWANAYVELALHAANKELLSGLAGEVKIRALSLEDQIATLRQMAKKIRLDRITRVEGALAIAESIGLESPADGAPLIAIDIQGRNTESINDGSLLYLRGAKALRAELQQLQQRETDDAYIAELPNLLKRQALLKSINLNPDLISVATIDRAAVVPEDPIKPNKRLIVLLGFILGGTLAILLVLFQHLIKRA